MRIKESSSRFVAGLVYAKGNRLKLRTLRDREYPPSKAQAANERDRELRYKISAIRVAHHQAAMEEIEPLMKVLSMLENCKPRPPILCDDGRLMQYVGPLPTWKPGDHFDLPTAE